MIIFLVHCQTNVHQCSHLPNTEVGDVITKSLAEPRINKNEIFQSLM